MKKQDFEKILEKKLAKLPHEERKKALDYYDELFADRLERGEDEDAIIESFGTPEEIAARIISENSKETVIDNSANAAFDSAGEESIWNTGVRKAKTTAKSIISNKTFLIVYFSLFFITIPLTIAAFSVLLSVCVAIFSIVITFAACGFSFIIGGIALIVTGGVACGTSASAGIAGIGCGLALSGVGIVLLECLKLLNYLRILIFVKKSNKPEAYKHAKKHMHLRRGFATVCVFLIAGVAVFGVGFGMADWNLRKLDTTEYTSFTQIISGTVSEINIDVTARDVQIIPVTENFRVDTHNYKQSTVTVSYEGDILTVKEKFKTFKFADIINFPAFAFVNQDLRTIKIYVPETLGKINAELNSGDLSISSCIVDEINVEATSGEISIKNCDVDNVNAKLTSGDVNIKNCTVEVLDVRVTSGDISVRLIGSRSDYTIVSSVTSGNNNAGENTINTSTGKSIFLKATSGDIGLSFV